MILKTFCSFLALVLELFGVYGDGEFKWYYGYVSFTNAVPKICLIQFS